MLKSIKLLCLDVGEKRIGVAIGDTSVKIAIPFDTVNADGDEIKIITELLKKEATDILVIGYPRNQSGESTAQTKFVEEFAAKLKGTVPKIVFQDESLTSVLAEQQLISYKHPYTKADIDAKAAAIILQDFMEINYA